MSVSDILLKKFPANSPKEYVIDSLFEFQWFVFLLLSFIVLYGSMIIYTWINRNKPHIECRSPKIMLVIFVSCFLDTIFKLIIRFLSVDKIDQKCKLALSTRMVLHNLIVIFLVVRIRRVHQVNTMRKEFFAYVEHNDAKQYNHQIKLSQDKQRLLREPRVITETFINFIAPLMMFTILTFFTGQFMFLTPVEESDACWLYYLTRAPIKEQEIS